MYKVLASDFDTLDKRIKSVVKKLNKYGLYHLYEVKPPVVELVKFEILDTDNNSHRESCVPVEVIYYDFKMDSIKLGEWSWIATINHSVDEDGAYKNLVHVVPGVEVDQAWWALTSTCEHCNTNRRRKTTVILQDQQGNRKQVGSTCIKEFTGIDIESVLGSYAELRTILKVELPVTEFRGVQDYVSTETYLAYCIQEVVAHGYQTEGVTSYRAWEYMKLQKTLPQRYIDLARDIISYFQDITDTEDSFVRNIQSALSQPYTKKSGHIAYAYNKYQKMLLEDAKLQEQTTTSHSEHMFEIGQKVDLELTLVEISGFQSNYGYTRIYKFQDGLGNIFKWFSTFVLPDDFTKGIIRFTVKNHSEYRGVKETQITRCKVVG